MSIRIDPTDAHDPQLFGDRTELHRAPLPLTVAGLQALFADVITEVAASEYGLTDVDYDIDDLIQYAETRMPAVFSRAATTRGPAVAALQSAIEHVEEAELPDGAMTWPPNPQWVCRMVDEVVTPLVSTFADFNIHLPGATDMLHRVESAALPKVFATVGEDGSPEARTGYIPSSSAGTDAQYVLQGSAGHVELKRRLRGDSDFHRLAMLPGDAAAPLVALLNWFRATSESPKS